MRGRAISDVVGTVATVIDEGKDSRINEVLEVRLFVFQLFSTLISFGGDKYKGEISHIEQSSPKK